MKNLSLILQELNKLSEGDMIPHFTDCCKYGVGGKCASCSEIWFECTCGRIKLNCWCRKAIVSIGG